MRSRPSRSPTSSAAHRRPSRRRRSPTRRSRCCAGWPTTTSPSSATASTGWSTTATGEAWSRRSPAPAWASCAPTRRGPDRCAAHAARRRPRRWRSGCSSSPRPTRGPPCTARRTSTTSASRSSTRTARSSASGASSACSPPPPTATSVRSCRWSPRKVAEVLDRSGLSQRSHSGKDLLEILETLPARRAVPDHHRRALPHRDRRSCGCRSGRRTGCSSATTTTAGSSPAWSTCRGTASPPTRLRMADILLRDLRRRSRRLHRPGQRVDAGPAAVRRARAQASGCAPSTVDEQRRPQRRLAEVTRPWDDDFGDALAPTSARRRATASCDRLRRAPSRGLQGDVRASTRRVADLATLDRLGDGTGTSVALYRPAGAPDDVRGSRCSASEPMTLSDVLPVLHPLGVEVVDERPYEVARADGTDPAPLRLRAARARRRDLGRVPADSCAPSSRTPSPPSGTARPRATASTAGAAAPG